MVFEEKMILNGEPEDEEAEEEEQDMVDPLDVVREKCAQAEHCVHTRAKLEDCESRVGSKSETAEDCTEELFDFLHARDHCVCEIYTYCRRQGSMGVAHKVFHSVK